MLYNQGCQLEQKESFSVNQVYFVDGLMGLVSVSEGSVVVVVRHEGRAGGLSVVMLIALVVALETRTRLRMV